MSYKLINYCEIDKFASQSYSRIHNISQDLNLGDITKVDTSKLSNFDMLVGGSPCQDFSASGKKAGAVWTCNDCGYKYNPLTAHYITRDECPKCKSKNLERTRSSLIVEYLRILREKKPKFCIYENVKNLIGKEFKSTFDLFVQELREYGYNVYYKVLNAKFYGVPQNRERIILVAIRKELDNGKFRYPEPFDSGIRLKDILATRIDKHFYISKEKTEKLLSNLDEEKKKKLLKSMNNINNIGLLDFRANRQCRQVNGINGICPTLTTMQGGQQEPKILVENMCPIYLKDNCIYKDNMNEIEYSDSLDTIKIRKYSVNISALQELLSMKKKENKLSNKEISNYLNIDKTIVDYWFRKDSSFLIPEPNIWFKLKKLLNIKNNSFDNSITEFVEIPKEYIKNEICDIENKNEDIIYSCALIACEPRTDGVVFFKDNVCGALRTIQSCGDKHIIEGIGTSLDLPLCCASRGRNPNNPNSRISGSLTEQRIEINENGTTNTLTSVQKDNYILEPCVLKYQRNEYGKEVRKKYELGEIYEKIGNMRDLVPRTDGMSNTLTTLQKDNYVFEPSWFAIRKLIPLECFRLMGFTDEDFFKAKYYTEEECKIIKKSKKKYKTEIDENEKEQIICLSDSQAYKQAGNSIVTNVLYEVYKELYKAMPYLFSSNEKEIDVKLISLFSGIGAFEKGLDMLEQWVNNENFHIEE